MKRVYSLLTIKSIDEDQRIIEGVATTPETDRAGDIVEPMGASFTLPIPFCWQHESYDTPVGNVIAAKPTKDGITVRVQLAKDDEPGLLKDRLDYAWRSIKLALVRGLSIGFQPIESADIEGTWGTRYIKWDWLELSAVTIPANAPSTIQTVKSLDSKHDRAASGARRSSPGVPGPVKVNSPPRNGATVKIAERISEIREARKSKAARMTEIQEAASAAGQTKDAAQQEEFDTLRDEMTGLDREIKDLETLDTVTKSIDAQKIDCATPARGGSSDDASGSRGTRVVAAPQSLPKGVRFARMARCIGIANRRSRDVETVARELYPDDALIAKAAVAAGTVGGDSWASGLVGTETSVFADFVEFLRPQTILGKFGTGNIPSLRRVPFRVPLIGQTAGGDAYWTGEGKAKGLTALDFARSTLTPVKLATIAVVSEELLRDSSPSADALLRDQLAAALRARLDTDFVDPSKALVADVSPASITNGVSGIASAGTSADNVRTDIKAIMAPFIAAFNAPQNGVWIMPATSALALSLMVNALGQQEFPGITMNGGTLFGLPVIVSEFVPTDSNGAIVVLANASDIYFADDGDVAVDVSREASLQMDTAPSGHSDGTPAAAQLVSMFQTNSIAFRAERTLNWKKRRPEAVQVLTGVEWGS